MGKSSPKPPNPYTTADAQTTQNINTSRVEAALNRGNTFTPFGTVTNRAIGDEWLRDKLAWAEQNDANYQRDPEGARRHYEAQNPFANQWESRVELSPEQQRLYEQGVALDTQTGQLALDMLPEARAALMAPMATDDADARERATAGIMSRMEPQFDRDRAAMETRLVNQGIGMGSTAWNRAMDELGRARNDARMQAVTGGLQESRQAATFANAQRAQRINELGMIFGLGPGLQMPGGTQQAPTGVSPSDLAGAVQRSYQARAQQAGADNATTASAASAAAMLAMMTIASDRRVKEDVRRVGELDNGLPVYSFRYKGSPTTQIGLMAQDVERQNPEAVADFFGTKRVNYKLATQ